MTGWEVGSCGGRADGRCVGFADVRCICWTVLDVAAGRSKDKSSVGSIDELARRLVDVM